MIKSTDNGIYSCISKSGKEKNRYNSSDEVIAEAKRVNKKYHSDKPSKVVGYKCPHCHYYHLTTTRKRVRKFF